MTYACVKCSYELSLAMNDFVQLQNNTAASSKPSLPLFVQQDNPGTEGSWQGRTTENRHSAAGSTDLPLSAAVQQMIRATTISVSVTDRFFDFLTVCSVVVRCLWIDVVFFSWLVCKERTASNGANIADCEPQCFLACKVKQTGRVAEQRQPALRTASTPAHLMSKVSLGEWLKRSGCNYSSNIAENSHLCTHTLLHCWFMEAI